MACSGHWAIKNTSSFHHAPEDGYRPRVLPWIPDSSQLQAWASGPAEAEGVPQEQMLYTKHKTFRSFSFSGSVFLFVCSVWSRQQVIIACDGCTWLWMADTCDFLAQDRTGLFLYRGLRWAYWVQLNSTSGLIREPLVWVVGRCVRGLPKLWPTN